MASRFDRPLVDWPLDELMAEAASLRDSAHGRLITYSRKVFIPLTKLCRDVCHYCTFAERPHELPGAKSAYVLQSAGGGQLVSCRQRMCGFDGGHAVVEVRERAYADTRG